MWIFVQLVLALTHIHARKANYGDAKPIFSNSWGKEQYPQQKGGIYEECEHLNELISDFHHPR